MLGVVDRLNLPETGMLGHREVPEHFDSTPDHPTARSVFRADSGAHTATLEDGISVQTQAGTSTAFES